MSIKDSLQLRFKVAALFLILALALVTSTTLAQSDSGSGFEIEKAQPVASAIEPASTAITPASNASPRLTDILRSGGPLMIPIGLCSFLLVVFTFERVISLRRQRIIPATFTRKFLTQLNEGELTQETATAICERDDSPMARVFKAGVHKSGANQPSKLNRPSWTKVSEPPIA